MDARTTEWARCSQKVQCPCFLVASEFDAAGNPVKRMESRMGALSLRLFLNLKRGKDRDLYQKYRELHGLMNCRKDISQ